MKERTKTILAVIALLLVAVSCYEIALHRPTTHSG
jgi:hypothetical protein